MENRVGVEGTTNQGCKFKVIEYFNCINCTIQFEDATIVKNIKYSNVKNGQIKNPNHPNVYGVGFMGQGSYKARIKKVSSNSYNSWISMMRRCYSNGAQLKCPTYIDCTVAEEWHNFQVFAKWHEENYNPETMQGWQLDKDILVKGNKIYGRDTCAFVPVEVNLLIVKCDTSRGKSLLGVSKKEARYQAILMKKNKSVNLGRFDTVEEAHQTYKQAKEDHIKDIAEEWKDRINPRVYRALTNYTIEITD